MRSRWLAGAVFLLGCDRSPLEVAAPPDAAPFDAAARRADAGRSPDAAPWCACRGGICDDKPVCKECPGEMHATGLQCEPAGLTCVFEPGCTAWTCQCTAKPGDVPRWVCRPNACRLR